MLNRNWRAQSVSIESFKIVLMYRFLILIFALTLMACDNNTPQEKPHEQEKHEVPVPVSKPQFDEVGERIWYGRTPAMRLDSTDYGAGLTSVFGMRTSSIPKQRFDSLFKQTVWEIKDIRVVETDLSLAKKNPGIMGWVTTTEFTCRNGVIVLHRQGINVNHVDTVNYVYDEVGNEIVLEGTGIRWSVLRLNKNAVEFLQRGRTMWGPFDWYYGRNSGRSEVTLEAK